MELAHTYAERPDCLVVGILGRGHMEYGFGTPEQLADLGIADVGLLLTQDVPAERGQPRALPDGTPIADAVFGLRSG